MPGVSQVIAIRERRRVAARRRPLAPFGMAASTLVSLLLAVAFILLPAVYISIFHNLPSLDALPALLSPTGGALLEPTRLYDRSNRHVVFTLENPAAGPRSYLPLRPPPGEIETSLPANLVAATVAALDPGFLTNWGFSLRGIRQGTHPTIAQRLVSSLLLWDERPGLRRALRERLLAFQVTSRYGREQVMEWFLNSARYGPLVYGAGPAARLYFGKPASALSLEEAAFLAAIPSAPRLDPAGNPEAAASLQGQVLAAMQAHRLVTPGQVRQATRAGLRLVATPASQPSPYQAYVNLVLDELSARIDRSRLEQGGLRVVTSLDLDLQDQAACAAAVQLERMSALPAGSSPPPPPTGCEAARLLPTLPASPTAFPADLQANLAILDPRSGEVLALVGDLPAHLQALPGRQPGTLLTPFVYLTGFARGLGPATLVWDIPDEIPVAGQVGSLADAGAQFHGPLRLRSALANDYPTPALRLLASLGPESVWATARQFGLGSLAAISGEVAYRLPLEGGSLTLLQVSQAYGILANSGWLAGRLPPSGAGESLPLAPVALLRLEDSAGQVWLDMGESQSRPIISPQLAFLLNNILSDEAARWPAFGHPNSFEIGRPAAVKPGQTRDGQNAWTVGYTPQLVVAAWIGSGNASPNQPSGPVPVSAAGALWHAVMQYAARSQPSVGWSAPPGIAFQDVCDPSGDLPTPACPAVVNEVFLEGNQPHQEDQLYRAFKVNRETGRLATIFTPSNLVQEKTFLLVPPEGRLWAQQAGIPSPPEDYDAVPPPASSPEVQISAPAMFAYVSGKVTVRGTVTGDNLDFYRLQAGKGLNPGQWLQIGQDVTLPSAGGALFEWDTSQLSGLYTLQLLKVQKDQSLHAAAIQVAVDNAPPALQILYPAQGEQVPANSLGAVTIQLSAADDLALKSVQFFMDGKLVAERSAPPFSLPWKAVPGEHVLKVVATDMAGNTAQALSNFRVK